MNEALVPVPKIEEDCYDFFERHAQVLAQKDAIDPEIVLVGDSITHFWGGDPVTPGAPRNGLASFARTFAGRRVLNLGFGFDRTQNALWRFANGELDGLRPVRAVVNIGTNNLPGTARCRAFTPEETAEGAEAVCAELEKRCPGVRIAVMAIFPRGPEPDDPFRAPVEATWPLYEAFAARRGWTFLNVASALLDEAGRQKPGFFHDGAHPAEPGYEAWGAALAGFLR